MRLVKVNQNKWILSHFCWILILESSHPRRSLFFDCMYCEAEHRIQESIKMFIPASIAKHALRYYLCKATALYNLLLCIFLPPSMLMVTFEKSCHIRVIRKFIRSTTLLPKFKIRVIFVLHNLYPGFSYHPPPPFLTNTAPIGRPSQDKIASFNSTW